MRIEDRLTILFAAATIILLLYITQGMIVNLEEEMKQTITKKIEQPISLAEKCRPLFDPGNEDLNSPWKRCIGVAPHD